MILSKQEKDILEGILFNLNSSSNTSWTQGGLREWVEFARNMKSSISDNSTILSALIKNAEIKDKF